MLAIVAINGDDWACTSRRLVPDVAIKRWGERTMSRLAEFRVGDLYTNAEIQTSLGVGNAGGVRLSTATDGTVKRAVILTSVPTARQATENPYHDRIEQDVLVYTGAGRKGNQNLGGVNARICQQLTTNFPAYGFVQIGSRRDASLGPRRWRYLGLLEYIRHYPESQTDTGRCIRTVWLFELRILSSPAITEVETDWALSERLLKESRATLLQTGDDLEIGHTPASSVEFDPQEIEAIRSRLLAKSPGEFEHFVKDLLINSGFGDVTVTRLSQDGGIDVNAHVGSSMWPVQGMLVQIQAKRWRHTVGRKEVAELRGSLEPFARGVVVTTSHFSRSAIAEAAGPGKAPIMLVDGYSLAMIVKRVGFSV